jgi:hypothetical protein
MALTTRQKVACFGCSLLLLGILVLSGNDSGGWSGMIGTWFACAFVCFVPVFLYNVATNRKRKSESAPDV